MPNKTPKRTPRTAAEKEAILNNLPLHLEFLRNDPKTTKDDLLLIIYDLQQSDMMKLVYSNAIGVCYAENNVDQK